MTKVTLVKCQCERCGHEWIIGHATEDPKVCPSCESPYWDTSKKDYHTFEAVIHEVLQDTADPMTWTEIRKAASLPQKFPNNKWVHRMERDIGLIRERAKNGTILWKLSEETNI